MLPSARTCNVIKVINQSCLSPARILHHSGFNSRLNVTQPSDAVRSVLWLKLDLALGHCCINQSRVFISTITLFTVGDIGSRVLI